MDEAVATVRALLGGAREEFERGLDVLHRQGRAQEYAAVLTGVFGELVERRFGAERRSDEIVRWVAGARSRSMPDPSELDPDVAERLLRLSLGDIAAGEGPDEEQMTETQHKLVFLLLQETSLDAEGVENLLEAARARGHRILTSVRQDAE